MKTRLALILISILVLTGTPGGRLNAADNGGPTPTPDLTLPAITGVHREETNIVVTVEVPEGFRRITLECRNRLGPGAWEPAGIARLNGAAAVVTFRLPMTVGVEMLRIRADETEPLPAAFYQGTSSFAREIAEGEATFYRGDFNTLAADGGAGVPFAPEPATTREVVESDIWKLHGDTLYFFNQLRGLQILDVSTPDEAYIRGTLSMPATGEQMYVLDDDHVILLVHDQCQGWSADGGSEILIVNVAEGRPTIRHSLPVPGDITESRLVGTALYVASQSYRTVTNSTGSGGLPEVAWESGLQISAFDLEAPGNPVPRNTLWFPGYGAVNTANDRFFFVALTDPTRSGFTDLQLIDISAPDGRMEFAGAIPLRGQLKDKFKIHQYGDVLVTIVEDRRWTTGTLTTWLETFTVADPAAAEKLAEVEVGRGEQLFATRFDGLRAYIVTFLQIDPLWVVDLSDPAHPRISGELEIPGWSTYIHPLGDRLVTIGIDNTAGWRVAVSLFDVADPADPRLLSKVPLGENHSWSEATQDEKAFTVLPEAGLILVPVTSYSTNQQQGIQLIDLSRDTLARRGFIEHSLPGRRATLHRERILSLSARELFSVDATDRDLPEVRAKVDLAWPVDRVFERGDYLLQIESAQSGYPYYFARWPGGYDQGVPSTVIRVAAKQDPDHVLTQQVFTNFSVLGAEHDEDRLYLLQGRTEGAGWAPNATHTRMIVFDLAQLPALGVLGESPISTNFLVSGGANAVRPKPGLVVWTGDSGHAYPWWGYPIGYTDALVPFGFMDWWWPYYDLQRQWAAFDVTDPETPTLRSVLTLTNGSWNISRAFATNGLVYQSRESQEHKVIGTNHVIVTNLITKIIATNVLTVTNVYDYPEYTYQTNVVSVTNVVDGPVEGPDSDGTAFTNRVYLTRTDLTARNAPANPVSVGAGFEHTAVTFDDGTVWAWGRNRFGQLGTGDFEETGFSTPVHNVTGATQLAAGGYHNLALETSGRLLAWGADLWGQVGDGDPPSNDGPPLPPSGSPVPVQVGEETDWVQVAAGFGHSLGVRADGSVWGWGANHTGQLGEGLPSQQTTPAQLAVSNATKVAAGFQHSLALTSDGGVFAWGDNSSGQLGLPAGGGAPSPVLVPGLPDILALAAGAQHSLALRADGAVFAWGSNQFGELGRGDDHPGHEPRPVAGLSNIVAISAGMNHSLARDADGVVWSWGRNDSGQLGDGTVQGRSMPLPVNHLRNVTSMTGGGSHSAALQADGTLVAWGNNRSGQLGNGWFSLMISEISIIRLTNWVTFTNVTTLTNYVQTNDYVFQTNAYPIHRYYRTHHLDVADYLAPAEPLLRSPVEIPGRLIGLSHEGALLYTVDTRRPPGAEHLQQWLEASAYDGVSAHLVDSLAVTNDYQTRIIVGGERPFLIRSEGGSLHLEAWALADTGAFTRIGARELAPPVNDFGWTGGLLVVRHPGAVALYDAFDPERLPLIGGELLGGCLGLDLNLTRGSREAGVWMPLGNYGAMHVPLFPEPVPDGE